MLIERLVSIKDIKKHLDYPIYLGVFCTLIAFFTALLLFRYPTVIHMVGISTVLIIVIICVPLISKLFVYEEELERKTQLNFLQEHKIIFDFFIGFFMGVFVTFFILAMIAPNLVFSEQQLYGQASDTENIIKYKSEGLPPPPAQKSGFGFIVKNNLLVMLALFLLSLFYGSGALFLIVLNASIFATALSTVIRVNLASNASFMNAVSFISCNLGIMLFHMIPEASSYVLVGIAGGVLSKAVTKEKVFSKGFNKILMDSALLVLIAVIVLFAGAIIETKVSQKLLLGGICLSNATIILVVAAVVIAGILFLEFHRRKKSRRE